MNEPLVQNPFDFSEPLVVGEVKILVAQSAGLCFGVERALNLSEKALTDRSASQSIYSLGPLIHNPQAVASLEERGLKKVDSLSKAQGVIVFRSHGVPLEVSREAQTQGLKVIDATCPLVKVPQNFARKLSQSGHFVVIVGDQDHPEVKGVRSFVENGRVTVLKDASEIDKVPADLDKLGVISQTTLKKSVFLDVVEKLQERFKEVKVHNTICSATKDRQEAALELADATDCVVVIGGRNSSNTQKLYDIARASTTAYLIETESELDPQWFHSKKTIGITAGASTPHFLIDKVRSKIAELLAFKPHLPL
jgi:(E)-4-hydroxy-3-methyl-but-2-enyl pyrophosphate reductase